MMKCTTYINKSLENKINKTLVKVKEYSIVGVPQFNDVNLVLKVSDFTEANYLLFEGIYYFIRSKQYINNRIVALSCEPDVLYTFKDQILSLNVLLPRAKQTKNSNQVPSDLLFEVTKEKETNIYEGFEDDEANGAYILVATAEPREVE